MDVKEGQSVVLAGVGVVRIQSLGDTVQATGGEDEPYEFPIDFLAKKVRQLSTQNTANAALRLFGESPLEIAREQRSRIYRRTHKGGDLLEMVGTLTFIYALNATDSLDERYQQVLEKAIFEELSAILDKSNAALKRSARSAGRKVAPKYLSAPDRSAVLDESLALLNSNEMSKEWNGVDALYVEECLIVGEHAAGLKLTALPGPWFVYLNSVDQDEIETIVAVHSEYTGNFASLPEQVENELLAIEGATMAVTDAWFAEDPDLLSELAAGEESIHGRCVSIGIGGDGTARVRHRDVDGRSVYVEIELS